MYIIQLYSEGKLARSYYDFSENSGSKHSENNIFF